MFIAFGNCLTSIYAGFVIFSIVGFMAHELGVEVKDVAAQGNSVVKQCFFFNIFVISCYVISGAGLAFIAYPEAVSRLPISPVWAILFFVMLLTLGLGTQFTLIETVVTPIVDTWPEKFRHRKPMVLLGVCTTMFAVGLLICSKVS